MAPISETRSHSVATCAYKIKFDENNVCISWIIFINNKLGVMSYKILNISQQDFANFQYENMKSLRRVGLHCDSIVAEKHPFYLEQSEVVSDITEVCRRMQDYDVIQFFHDNVGLYNSIKAAFGSRKIIAYHTSSVYRKYHETINHTMALYVDVHVSAMPEFIAMCPESIYMVGAVDTEKIKPGNWTSGDNTVFAHFPSNLTVKGTAKIIELMSRTDAKFVYSTDLVGYNNQLMRMNECDVYIEMFTQKDALGNPYGDFGITALEAAAMGKIVITNSKHRHAYETCYDTSFFYAPQNENAFLNVIDVFRDKLLVETEQQRARYLVEKNHSHKVTGEYFLKNVLNE